MIYRWRQGFDRTASLPCRAYIDIEKRLRERHSARTTVCVEDGAVTVTVMVGSLAAARTVKNAKTKRKRLNVRANIAKLVARGVFVFSVGLLGVLRPPFYVCSTRRYLRCAILTLMANIADVF